MAIVERTKAALAAAKARGVKLGGDPKHLNPEARRRSAAVRRAQVEERYRMSMPLAVAWRREDRSLAAIADELTALGVAMARSGSEWSAVQVRRLLRYAERARVAA